MAEYIEREAALSQTAILTVQTQEYGRIEVVPVEYIADLPIVSADDAAPVVHGRWEDGNEFCPICGKSKFDGLDADIWADWKPKYCPNCGAKMQEAR